MTRQDALMYLSGLRFKAQLGPVPPEETQRAADLIAEFNILPEEAASFTPPCAGSVQSTAEDREYDESVPVCTLTENEELKGLELKFPSAPGKEVTLSLSKAGWRYHGRKRIWYIRKTDGALSFARTLAGVEA